MGLAASAVLDIAIACGLCFYLRQSKSGFSTYVDARRLFTFLIIAFSHLNQYGPNHRHAHSLHRGDWAGHLVSSTPFMLNAATEGQINIQV